MSNNMFCFQCEQTAGCGGCTGSIGVCGKNSKVANLQDELTGALIGLARTARKSNPSASTHKAMIEGLFTTLTNVNFNEGTIISHIESVRCERNSLISQCSACSRHFTQHDEYEMNSLWTENEDIPAPVLFTTNCLMPPKDSYSDRVFTTEVVSFPDIVHISDEKDFTPVIQKALELGGFDTAKEFSGINGGKFVTTGFGHNAVLSVADKVIDAVKAGALKHISGAYTTSIFV